ncbi:LCP family protein [Nonomuraea typhae]|uniref:LCP family protein n=1 Tax=Nonomuraea typhae TaxID=2603600 RepID=UPI0012FC9FE1|nr:LCP family protein [Nonomuraea typhae]
MDDLKLLRDFGGELEQEPPATLVRQRARLMGGGPAPRRRWNGMVLVAAAAATALAVAVPTLLLGNRARDVAGGSPSSRSILMIGSDNRPGNAGMRADTIVLVHLPAGRGNPKVVNIPRDTLVTIPKCGGQPSWKAAINTAYDKGGADCLIRTLQKEAGLRIDHTVEVDFDGFKRIVDALGGVEVRISEPINDSKAKLTLSAGRHKLDGEKALGFFRLRNIGEGSDLERIKRQQKMLSELLAKARETVVKDPVRLREFVSVARQAVRTDLDLETLYQTAVNLAGSQPSFATVPTAVASGDPNRLTWSQPGAKEVFDSLR